MKLSAFVFIASLLLPAATAVAAPAVAKSAVNLRETPSGDGRVLGVLPGGSTVNVFDCDAYWCRVGWGKVIGYAARRFLSVDQPVNTKTPAAMASPPMYEWHHGWRHRYWHYQWRFFRPQEQPRVTR